MSMITATAWVPRGYAAAFPTKYVFDESEYGRIAKLAKLQLDDAEEDLEEAQAAAHGSSENKKSAAVSNDQDKEYVLPTPILHVSTDSFAVMPMPITI
jgi:periodic tryptophan protein 1